MFEAVFGIDKAIVVDKVFFTGVVWGVDVDDADGFEVGMLEGIEGVVVIATDEDVWRLVGNRGANGPFWFVDQDGVFAGRVEFALFGLALPAKAVVDLGVFGSEAGGEIVDEQTRFPVDGGEIGGG